MYPYAHLQARMRQIIHMPMLTNGFCQLLVLSSVELT